MQVKVIVWVMAIDCDRTREVRLCTLPWPKPCIVEMLQLQAREEKYIATVYGLCNNYWKLDGGWGSLYLQYLGYPARLLSTWGS